MAEEEVTMPFSEETITRFKIAKLVIATLGTVLNIAVILFILIRKMYRKSYEFSYLNMAVADLLFALVLAVLVCPRDFAKIPDNILCRATPILENYMSYVNLLCILPITVDRFIAVVFPVRYTTPAHRKTLISVILLCWLLPLIWTTGFSFHIYSSTGALVFYENLTSCCHFKRCEPPESCAPFFYSLDVITMILPLVFNVISYTLIMRALQRSTDKISLNTKIVVARAFLTSLTFSLSWMPFFVIFRILGHANFMNYTLIMMFSPINTVTDPCLYIVPNDFIKTALRKIRVFDPHSIVHTATEKVSRNLSTAH